MLVLTRKVNEAIECNGPCKITIVAIEAGKVRVGLTGPEETEFVRSELTGKNSTRRKKRDDKRTA